MVVSDLGRSRFLGELSDGHFKGEFFFAVKVPVKAEGNVLYVLSLLARPTEVFQTLSHAYRPDDWLSFVVDQKGRIVARSHAGGSYSGKFAAPEVIDKSARAQRAIVEAADLEGQRSIFAVTQVPGTEWKAAVWAPAPSFADRSRAVVIGLPLLNILLLASIILWLTRRSAPGREAIMLGDEEHVAASSGKGLDIAGYRMAAANNEANAIVVVEHILAAIEALSLHLTYVEAGAEAFRRKMHGNNLPRASADDLSVAAQ